jgi:uncharacterized protein
MRPTVLIPSLLFATLVLGPVPGNAQSFNCRYAHRADERVICRRPNLSRLDERLARRYNRVHERSGRGMRRLLEREQASWLRPRHACGHNAGCIRRHYRTRIAELNAFGRRTRHLGYR